MDGKHNKYLLPQKRPENFRRLQSVLSKDGVKSLKEGIKDLTTNREEDSIYGQDIEGNSQTEQTSLGDLTVPRYGFNKIEEDDVTDELLWSYMWMAQQAELRAQRVSALTDIESIRGMLLNKQYGDKHGESTTTYKMFDDFVRANIYGQVETLNKGKYAPIVKSFQGFVRLNNLGFNILTPLTSLLQGSTNYLIERFVGSRIDKDAAKAARKVAKKMLAGSSKETFSIVGTNELSMLATFLGQGDSLERFKNSGYSTGVRFLDKSAYLTHSLADAPIATQVMLTVLHDFRVVGNEILNFAQYRNKIENKTESIKALKEEWKKYDDQIIYNYLKVEKGENEKYGKYKVEIPGFDSTYVNQKMQNIRNTITLAKQEIDSQIPAGDRTFMQRHAVWSFFSLHKNWLVTSATRRFKSRHQNLHSGIEEEGSYNGAYEFIVDIVKSYKQEKNLRKAIMTTWNEADNTRKESIKRASLDLAVTSTLALVAILMKDIADDDDKDYVTQFSAYLTYRLATEVTSQSTGIPMQAYKFVESPTVGISQFNLVLDAVAMKPFSGDAVKSGTYVGLTERQAFFMKGLPGLKEYWKIKNIDRTKASYEEFNKELRYFTIPGLMFMSKDEEEE